MNRTEERFLYDRMKSGDESAREELILEHEALVHKIVNGYRSSGDPEDLIQEGFLGLMTALDKYDIDKGRLHVYAQDYIRRSIEDFLNKMRYPVSMPRGQYYAINKLIQLRSQLEQERQKPLTENDLIKEEAIIDAHLCFQKTYNSQIPIRSFVSLLTYSEETYSLNPEIPLPDLQSGNDIERMELEDLCSHLINSLSKQEQFILKSLSAGRNRADIASDLNIDVQRVSNIRYEAKKKVEKIVRKSEEFRTVLESYGITI